MACHEGRVVRSYLALYSTTTGIICVSYVLSAIPNVFQIPISATSQQKFERRERFFRWSRAQSHHQAPPERDVTPASTKIAFYDDSRVNTLWFLSAAIEFALGSDPSRFWLPILELFLHCCRQGHGLHLDIESSTAWHLGLGSWNPCSLLLSHLSWVQCICLDIYLCFPSSPFKGHRVLSSHHKLTVFMDY